MIYRYWPVMVSITSRQLSIVFDTIYSTMSTVSIFFPLVFACVVATVNIWHHFIAKSLKYLNNFISTTRQQYQHHIKKRNTLPPKQKQSLFVLWPHSVIITLSFVTRLIHCSGHTSVSCLMCLCLCLAFPFSQCPRQKKIEVPSLPIVF